MANIFKKKTTVKDKTTGQRVEKETKKWYARYRDALGTERVKPLSTDQKVSQQMLNKICCGSKRKKLGYLIRPKRK